MSRALLLSLIAGSLFSQTPKITTPKQALGFNIGDDYQMASYTQLETYWKKLASESDRMKLVDIGLTAEGRHQWMAVISSPATSGTWRTIGKSRSGSRMPRA